VGRLARRDDLNLAPPHPPRVHFTYLDPTHRELGGRWHDSITVGDSMSPSYKPEVVVISENKDTAIHFPPLPAAVAVEGVGRGAGAIAAVPWLAYAPLVVYWGDMDADRLEILNEFRAAGIDAVSLFMDLVAYERWERFGTNHDPQGKPIRTTLRRPAPHLTSSELKLYDALTSEGWTRYRRVEQERIPLGMAFAEVSGFTKR
jgi:hypothetical protein